MGVQEWQDMSSTKIYYWHLQIPSKFNKLKKMKERKLFFLLFHFPQIGNARYWSRKIPLIVDYFEEEMSTTLIDRPGNQWQGEQRHGRSCHCHLRYSTLSQGYCENRETPQLNLRKKKLSVLKTSASFFLHEGGGGVVHIIDLPPSGPPSQTSSSQSSPIFHTRRVEWDWYCNFLER